MIDQITIWMINTVNLLMIVYILTVTESDGIIFSIASLRILLFSYHK